MINRLLFLLVFLFVFTGCGGGSAGTGLGSSSSVEGRILQQGKPLSGATVTIIETGDTGKTDTSGAFLIAVTEELVNYTLEIQYQNTSKTVPVSASTNGSIINVEIDVKADPATPLDVASLEVEAKIVGICDTYFENKRVIRQSNKAPDGVECTAKVKTSSESKPLGGVRFAVQHRKCEENGGWTTDAISETSVKFAPGIGQLQFRFFNDPKHCYYRIIVPYETMAIRPSEILIETFTAQDFGSRMAQSTFP